jgi:menaquinol-cytochrome c reductase iron-sulfur subunit
MTDADDRRADIGRRNFLSRAIVAIQATIGATIAFILGATTLAPTFGRRESAWLRAASLAAIADDEPLVVTLRIGRNDGFTQIVDRTLVYLVRNGDGVRALSSTCTHLGCRTSYDRQTRRILCPCHGGVYDVQGSVLDGPPPAPLPELRTTLENGDVFVRVP